MSEINPSVPQEQPTQNQTETKPLTPEQIEQRVLEEALELSWLDKKDLQKFYKDCSSCNIQTLRQELETTPEEQLIEKQARELYKIYLEKGLDSWNTEVVSLDTLSKSIDSPRLEDMKNEIEKVLEESLKKYDFLDDKTKNFVKIWIVNSMLKSPVWEIWESLVWGFANFVERLSTVKQDDLSWMVKTLNPNPKDSWRTLALEEKFAKNLENYTKKFNEIKWKLDDKTHWLTPKQKQNIISNIDWFKNPALIEAWVDWLDMSQLKIENKDKENETLDTKSISEYMVNSREKILDLSKKLNMWDKAWDTIYELINGGWMVWEWVQKIVEIILKLPFIWKFFAMFLGLNPDPEKALSELKENSSNFKLVSALKWLWATLDKDWKVIPWKEWKKDFEKIDLSWINFNVVKNEMKEVKNITWEQSEEWYQKMWQEAFDKWIDKDWVKLKFDLWDKKDWKLTNSKLKEILKNGLKNFNEDKEKNKTETETARRLEETTKNQDKLNELSLNVKNLNSQIDNITSIINKDYEKVRHWDDVFNVGDINDIKTQDVINHNGGDFNTLIETSLKTGSLDDISKENLMLTNTLFSFIQDYCKENSLSNQWEIKDFLKNNETGFNTWLNTKRTEIITQRDWKQNEIANLEWNQEKLDFARTVWEKIKAAPDNKSLLWNWIDLWEDKKLSLNKDSQELNIWDEKFKIELTSKWEKYNLKDIKITGGKVEFIPDIEDFKLVAARAKDSELWFTSKEKIINWITDLVTKWNFTHEKNETKLSFSKVIA